MTANPDSALASLRSVADSAGRRRRRSRNVHSNPRRLGTFLGLTVLAGVIGFAPLAAGAVHRSTGILALGLTLASIILVAFSELTAGIPIRLSTQAAILLLIFALIPALQCIPLPAVLTNWLDPAAADLLVDGHSGAFRPLSMDPPATWFCLGQASAAMATAIISAHAISGRTARYLLLRAIVLAGIAAVMVGVGHRILREDRIYGIFPGSRGILNGPFINPNHTAEFLEIALFSAVAMFFTKPNALNRVAWTAAGIFILGGIVGTLSRGGILGLGASALLFTTLYRRTSSPDEGSPRTGRSWVYTLIAACVCILVATSLGASQILSKFSQADLTQETRFRLWRDGLKLLLAHPLGIGRGAFDRVYPTVRTVESPISVRYSFLENEPLQFLVDTGWIGTAAILTGIVLFARHIWRSRRADRVELALVCGLVSVIVHSLVDFGLETLGVLLPLSALLGAILGRLKDWSALRMPRSRVTWVLAVAILGLLASGVALALPSSADFDGKLRSAKTPNERRALAIRAQSAHPFDYYYVLQQAITEPLLASESSRSPRLSVLNRALLLCPNCPEVHTEIGRSLWLLGMQRQALAEWRAAAAIRPVLALSIVDDARRLGVRPDQLAAIGEGNTDLLIGTAKLLLARSDRAGARRVLDSASTLSASADSLLLRADLDIGDGQIDQASRDLDEASIRAPNDPRVFLIRADLLRRSGDINAALDTLNRGATLNPDSIPLHDRRVRLIVAERKWSHAQSAIDGLEAALFRAGLPTDSVHTARAQLAAELGDSKTALSEYRAAINQNPDNPTLWMSLARYYDSIWRTDDALKAMHEAHERAPDSAGIAQEIKQLTDRRDEAQESARRRDYLDRSK